MAAVLDRQTMKDDLANTLKDFYDVDMNCDFIIDGMCDELESRVCANCTKHAEETCPIYYEAYNLHYTNSDKDFGCTEFIRRS